MFALDRLLLPAFAAATLLAPRAAAQGFQISFGKQGKHGGLALTYSNDFATRCAPAHYCPPQRAWLPGHYETRCEQVWVQGPSQQVYVPAVYEWRHDCFGRAYQVCARPAHWETVCQPGHFESRPVRVWVDGCWR